MTLPEGMYEFIREVASKFPINTVVLFGSRAKDTCWEYSDIDLAITGTFDSEEFFEFKEALDEFPDLFLFDVVDMNSSFVSAELLYEIAEDGVIIYEKI